MFFTFAGLSGTGSSDGTGSAARFNTPAKVAVDNAGNVYIADNGNSTVRKVTPGGVVSTLAGEPGFCGSNDGTGSAAQFCHPQGIAVDDLGNVYVSDSTAQNIRKITPAGVVSTVAGTAFTIGSADGIGAAARFNTPQAIAVDSAGTLYVADSNNNTIRTITPGGVVSTLAGSAGGVGGSADGTGSAARFNAPRGIAVDGAGTVFVADTVNRTVRKIMPGGVVSTLAGLAGTQCLSIDGAISVARFCNPYGVAVDTGGTVYVADQGSNTVRTITSAGVVTTLAGLAFVRGKDDGTGTAARFYSPQGVAVDGAGTVFVGDTINNTIRRITPAGAVTTLAGFSGVGSADGAGSAARFSFPAAVAVDRFRTAYVGDYNNSTIRTITPSGVVTTLAGVAGVCGNVDGTGSAARLCRPAGLAVDSAGTIYVADQGTHTIRTITPAGVVSTLAGAAFSPGSADGTGSAARFNNPQAIAVDGAGTVYVADTQNQTIRTITPAGVVSTLAGLAGNIGTADGTGNAARFNSPRGVAVDGAGTVFVADTNNQAIRKIAPGGVVSTLAGLAGTTCDVMDGTGSGARFCNPIGLGVDAAGTVYVAEGSSTLRTITPAGVVSTLAGEPFSNGSVDGAGFHVRFNFPQGIAVTSAGTIYVADASNNTIRRGGTIPTGGNADFDGDLIPDMTVYRPSSGLWFNLKSSTGTFSTYSWGTSTDIAVPADYDGDGLADIAIWRPSTGAWWILESSSNFTTYTTHLWGTVGDIPLAATLDDDTKADLAVFRPSNGTWYAAVSSEDYAFSGSLEWGVSSDVPVAGDYDGDGFTDVAIFRPSTGVWWVLKSSTDYSEFTSFGWGDANDIVVPGDYDGDGKNDYAVFRPSTGTWFVAQSTTNFATFFSTPWGASGDIPVPGDYDGDGKADLALWRPSSGFWWILQSDANFTTFTSTHWGTTGDIPINHRP